MTTQRPHLSKLQWVLLVAIVMAGTLILIQSKQAPYRTTSGTAFGTTFTVKYKWSEQLDREITACLQAVDQSMSMFNDSSTVARINRNETTEVDNLFAEVYKLSAQISEKTNGYFDITVKPLVDAWGFGTTQSTSPTGSTIDSLLNRVGYKKISLEGKTLKKQRNDITLDFSAVAKGYACDLIAKQFKNLGVTDYMIEIGGEIACRGNSSDHDGWYVGISKPTDDSLSNVGGLQTRLLVSDRGIATSGNYHRFYYKNGQKVAHTVNPHTGQAVSHSLLSATVISSSTAQSDAFATAFMAAGVDTAKQILKKNPNIAAYLIYADSKGELKIWQTDNFKQYLAKE